MNELKRKEQNYDTWLHWNVTYRCNLSCVYCFFYSDRPGEEIPKIDIPALIRTLDRTKRIFRISFSGGEPFLIPNIIDACVEVAKKHFVSFNTNLITGDIKEFAERINPERVLHIMASLHIKELERHNLLDKYIKNFVAFRRKGFNIIADVIAYPSLLDEVKKYKQYFKKKGIKINFSPFDGIYSGKQYPKSYSKEDLEAFGLEVLCSERFSKQGEFCIAGYNVGVVLPLGNITPCVQIQEEIGNVYKEINFRNELTVCPFDYCSCPVNIYDPYLFEKAIQNSAEGAGFQGNPCLLSRQGESVPL